QALYRDLVVHPRHHDLARARLARTVHGEQVAVEDAGVAHTHAADFQQVVGTRLEQGGIDLAAPLDMLLGEDGAACGDAADERQPEAFGETDAARGARSQLDRAFPLQHAQMLFGGVGRAVAECVRDLDPGRREAGLLDGFADEVEDFLLLWGEFFGHRAYVSVFIYSLCPLGKGRILARAMAARYESVLNRMLCEMHRDRAAL